MFVTSNLDSADVQFAESLILREIHQYHQNVSAPGKIAERASISFDHLPAAKNRNLISYESFL